MEKKLDLRVVKTLNALTEALYTLMCQKSLDEITVTEICDRAMIRKATFYKHFSNKYDLLRYMLQDLQRTCQRDITSDYDTKDSYSFYVGVFSWMMDFVEDNDIFVSNVLKGNSGNFVLSIIQENIRLDIDKHLTQENRPDVQEAHGMLSAIYASAIVGCITWWKTQDNSPSKEQMIVWFNNFVRKL